MIPYRQSLGMQLEKNKLYHVIQIERNVGDDLSDTKINHGIFDTKEAAIQYIREFLRDWAHDQYS